MTVYWAQKVSRGGNVGLVPTTRETEELFLALNNELPVKVEVKQPRNGKHHRLFWTKLGHVAENSENFRDSDDVAKAIKHELGMYDVRVIMLPDGKQFVDYVWESISYADKDQAKFAQFYERAMDVIAKWGFDVDELERMNA